jgi:steroid 5-alpha reductase family enzyme
MQIQKPKLRYTKTFSLLTVACGYVVSYAISAFVLQSISGISWHPLWKLFAANLVGMFVLFLFARLSRNSSFFDAYWSVAPPLFLVYLIPLDAQPGWNFRQILVFSAVFIWAIRLTLNWARHWGGFSMEDFRYIELKKGGGLKGFLVDFSAIHFFPALMVFAICLPLYPAVAEYSGDITVFDLLAFTVALCGVILETVADEQMHAFKRRIKKPSEFMRSGVWAYSRHPNYFGEWLFWVGVFLMGLSANPAYYWTGFGLFVLLSMFLGASIPMMEKRMIGKRPDYAAYQKKVSAFIPLPNR